MKETSEANKKNIIEDGKYAPTLNTKEIRAMSTSPFRSGHLEARSKSERLVLQNHRVFWTNNYYKDCHVWLVVHIYRKIEDFVHNHVPNHNVVFFTQAYYCPVTPPRSNVWYPMYKVCTMQLL